MKVDGGIDADPANAGRTAELAEAASYDGAWIAETNHDPFIASALAAEHTSRIELGTGIAVAFARNPMTVAQSANDVHAASGGRFILGLGSQIKPHITKRYSMPWSRPAARMKEFIAAMHAIWRNWNEDEPLRFEGEFYTHTLMTPFFRSPPNPHGRPRVFLAAVGEKMTRVAGEIADGMLVHAFTTQAYLREVTLPAIEAGLADSGRSRSDFELSIPAFVVTGADEEQMERAAAPIRQQIAFYGSTPAYKPVLDLHGWGDLQPELNTLSKRGEWVEMGRLITDDILGEFAVIAPPDEVASGLKGRYDGVIDRLGLYSLAGFAPDVRDEAFATLRS